jgi:motility quorum-sensing regulator/GCU-specific mRNA interferase toxin
MMHMEKRTPHYSLAVMQTRIAAEGKSAFTLTAVRGGQTMGVTRRGMLVVIARLNGKNFYKSMTTYGDHTIWQDVYHAYCPNGKFAYIKLTQAARRIVIQFKEIRP